MPPESDAAPLTVAMQGRFWKLFFQAASFSVKARLRPKFSSALLAVDQKTVKLHGFMLLPVVPAPAFAIRSHDSEGVLYRLTDAVKSK